MDPDPVLDDVDELVPSIDESLKTLAGRGGDRHGDRERQRSGEQRRGSRFVGDGASRSLVERVAKGGSYSLAGGDPIRPPERRESGGLAKALLGALDRKALAEGTGSAGGYLVPVETSEEVVKLIRARSAVMRLGPPIVPVRKELDVASIASGATPYYVDENTAIPASE